VTIPDPKKTLNRKGREDRQGNDEAIKLLAGRLWYVGWIFYTPNPPPVGAKM